MKTAFRFIYCPLFIVILEHENRAFGTERPHQNTRVRWAHWEPPAGGGEASEAWSNGGGRTGKRGLSGQRWRDGSAATEEGKGILTSGELSSQQHRRASTHVEFSTEGADERKGSPGKTPFDPRALVLRVKTGGAK